MSTHGSRQSSLEAFIKKHCTVKLSIKFRDKFCYFRQVSQKSALGRRLPWQIVVR